ncbi:hypothetical protein IAR50_006573 [Cryptococcus sp. DSM 104548]
MSFNDVKLGPDGGPDMAESDQQVGYDEDQEEDVLMNALMIPFTSLYSQTYTKVLFALSHLTLTYLTGLYTTGVAFFPPVAASPQTLGSEAIIQSKDRKVLRAIKEKVEEGKAESQRRERVWGAVRELVEEGWPVHNGPKSA